MSDASHEPEATQIDLAGYRACHNEFCGELVLLEISYRTKGLCVPCFRDVLGKSLTEVEIRNKGRELTLIHERSKRSKDKGNHWTHRAGTRARIRADRRLRGLFRELYDVLLAEERARAGLEPFPAETLVKDLPAEDAFDSIDFAYVYAALDEHGVDVDAPQDPPT